MKRIIHLACAVSLPGGYYVYITYLYILNSIDETNIYIYISELNSLHSINVVLETY